MDKINLFVLSEDGTYLEKEAIDLVKEVLNKSFEIVNAPELNHILMKAGTEAGKPVRNAHNDPLYLLGEVENSEYPVVLVAWYEDEDEEYPKPKFFVSKEEWSRLLEELAKNPKEDAWEIAIRVNKELRG